MWIPEFRFGWYCKYRNTGWRNSGRCEINSVPIWSPAAQFARQSQWFFTPRSSLYVPHWNYTCTRSWWSISYRIVSITEKLNILFNVINNINRFCVDKFMYVGENVERKTITTINSKIGSRNCSSFKKREGLLFVGLAGCVKVLLRVHIMISGIVGVDQRMT